MAEGDIDMEYLERQTTLLQTTLLQFGSKACVHCPKATSVLGDLTAEYAFSWIYQDCSSPLVEEFSITRLPAIVVWTGDRKQVTVYQGLRGDAVKKVVTDHCAARLENVDF